MNLKDTFEIFEVIVTAIIAVVLMYGFTLLFWTVHG